MQKIYFALAGALLVTVGNAVTIKNKAMTNQLVPIAINATLPATNSTAPATNGTVTASETASVAGDADDAESLNSSTTDIWGFNISYNSSEGSILDTSSDYITLEDDAASEDLSASFYSLNA